MVRIGTNTLVTWNGGISEYYYVVGTLKDDKDLTVENALNYFQYIVLERIPTSQEFQSVPLVI